MSGSRLRNCSSKSEGSRAVKELSAPSREKPMEVKQGRLPIWDVIRRGVCMSVSKRDIGTSQVIRRGDNPSTPAMAPANGSRAVAHAGRPPALVGVAIPGRDRSIRRMVVELYRENPHLPSASRGIVSDYCKVVRSAERVYQRWQGKGFEPGRDADLFMKATAEARHHASVLGLTPVSMAALGVHLGRLQTLDLAQAMSADGEDVAELEGRIIERLQRGGGGSSGPPSAPASSEERDS